MKKRPLTNILKLALVCRFLLYALFSVFLIKLSGDIEINPGPESKQSSHNNRPVKCLGLNARSLMSVTKTNDRETVSNLERFQNLVYSEDIDIVFVNETWLSNNINNAEILNSEYTIVPKRSGRQRRRSFCWGLERNYLNLYVKLSIITIWRLFWLS